MDIYEREYKGTMRKILLAIFVMVFWGIVKPDVVTAGFGDPSTCGGIYTCDSNWCDLICNRDGYTMPIGSQFLSLAERECLNRHMQFQKN